MRTELLQYQNGEISQKIRQNAKITNIDEIEALKTAINAKVSQADKRIPGEG